MEKYILYLLFFLFFGFLHKGFSQISSGTARYKLEINGVTRGGCCGCCGGLRRVELTLRHGQKVSLHEESDAAIEISTWNFDYTQNPYNTVASVYVRAKDGSGDGPHSNGTANMGIGTSCKTVAVGPFGGNKTEFQVITYRQVTLVDNSSSFSDITDPFRINLDSELHPSHINWQYTTTPSDETSWEYLPSFHRSRANLSILGKEFLSPTDNGKTIYFRNDSGCSVSYDKIINTNLRTIPVNKSRYSNIITSQYLVSAPKIKAVEPIPVSCFNSNDGGVKIEFDRALRNGEKLSLAILDLDDQIGTIKGVPIYESVQSVTDIPLGPDDSFTLSDAINKPLPSGNLRVQLLGFINGASAYIEGIDHRYDFTIENPKPVTFSATEVDVGCNGGSDGKIVLSANGGTDNYEYKIDRDEWLPFTTGRNHTISGLAPSIYNVKVRDSNGCIAKEIVRDGKGDIIGLNAEITETIEIEEPDKPVAVNFVYHTEPTAFGFSNGRIRAQITGGTPLPDGRYNYTWTHENRTQWTAFTDILNSDGWFLTLENAIAGKYRLTITDAEHSNARDTTGCTIIEAEFTLTEPPPLHVSIQETKVISCNSSNTFGNPSSNGELTVTATGGVPFNPLIAGQHAYIYTWKKKNSSGIYEVIEGENSAVLSNIDAGDYAVNIEDANGIVLGTYKNNTLVTPTDELYTLNQPELLQISLNKVDVFCNAGNDGSIDATITGGTGNYTINWSTGETTEDIEALVAGAYTINVTDEKGCRAQASMTIDEPDSPLEISYAFFNPRFAGATDGWIEATVTGGTPLDTGAYSFTWKNSNEENLNAQVTETINENDYVIKLNTIGVGVYNLTIEDKNYPFATNKNNCTVINSSHELFEPEPLMASIRLNTPISCNSNNTYGDPFSDGALEVVAEGGIRLRPSDNGGLPYYYTWKKEIGPGVWEVLTAQTTNIATDLDVGNYAVNIEDANGIVLGVYQNNVLAHPTDVSYLFEEPELLSLGIDKGDVYCFQGSDGWAETIISGGVPPYDILWDNGDTTERTTNLNQGIYEVAVTDSRGCSVSGSIQIDQPTGPLNISYTAFTTPSTAGASNGWIEARITGGTSFLDGSYTYYWQDRLGTILNAQTTTSIVDGTFQIRLNNIPKGSYHLTIEDANFPQAITKNGCTALDDEFVLYDPIEATISVHTPISCHQDNVFNNPFSDGALRVTVTGGLPFSTGEPYNYTWKKEIIEGVYDNLNQNSDIATGLSDGNYALNVEDSRGVVIGTYESLNLINATDVYFLFKEPEFLEVSITKTEISCDAGNDATATVAITGGIPPYDIRWSNGQDTARATDLIAGNHVVYVTDARGCITTGNISIDQPGGLSIVVVEEKHPTCAQGNDGKIQLGLSGGTPPYTYSWNIGTSNTGIENLSQGTYLFSLTDANGCTAFKEIVLQEPDEIVIDLGEDIVLCKDQTYTLDGGILDEGATYVWISDNGFNATTPQIAVSEAGTYNVTATSSSGCTATDSIVVSYSDTAIDSEFLLPSHAYLDQDIVLFNVSSPVGETSQWDIPDNATIVDQGDTFVTVRFLEAATYKIGLISTQGACSKETYKNIVVEKGSGLVNPGDTKNPFIEEFTLSPNPNKGRFELYINLAEPSPIAVRVFTVQSSLIYTQPNVPMAEEYILPLDLNLLSGTYFVVLETAKQTQLKQMIVN